MNNWIVRIYNKKDSIIESWTIENRNESEAMNEASADVHRFSESNDEYDSWSMTEKISIGAIVESYHNGQLKQMADFIDSYGLYDIWLDLRNSIIDKYGPDQTTESFQTYSEIVITYHRIRNK